MQRVLRRPRRRARSRSTPCHRSRRAWAGTTSRSRARCAQWILRSSSSTTTCSSTPTPRMSFERSREVYDRHVGRYSSALARALIERTGVRDGDGALDVGCGPGALTEALAERLGERNVAAVDPSHSFVDECRRRVPGADVRLGAAETLPFPDASFDVVSSQLVGNSM